MGVITSIRELWRYVRTTQSSQYPFPEAQMQHSRTDKMYVHKPPVMKLGNCFMLHKDFITCPA